MQAWFSGSAPLQAPIDLPFYNGLAATNSNTRYVNPNQGSDAFDGLTPLTAWQHLSYAAVFATNATGGTVIAMPGVYFNDGINLSPNWSLQGTYPSTIISNLVDGVSGVGLGINNNTKISGMRQFGGTFGGSGTNVIIYNCECSSHQDSFYMGSVGNMTIDSCHLYSQWDACNINHSYGTNWLVNTHIEVLTYDPSNPLGVNATRGMLLGYTGTPYSTDGGYWNLVNSTIHSHNILPGAQTANTTNSCIIINGGCTVQNFGSSLSQTSTNGNTVSIINGTYIDGLSTIGGKFTGNGANLTNIPASALTGNVTTNQFISAVTAAATVGNASTNFTQQAVATVISNTVYTLGGSGPFTRTVLAASGDNARVVVSQSSGETFYDSAGALQLSVNPSGVTAATGFVGNGSGLTSVNASSISIGTGTSAFVNGTNANGAELVITNSNTGSWAGFTAQSDNGTFGSNYVFIGINNSATPVTAGATGTTNTPIIEFNSANPPYIDVIGHGGNNPINIGFRASTNSTVTTNIVLASTGITLTGSGAYTGSGSGITAIPNSAINVWPLTNNQSTLTTFSNTIIIDSSHKLTVNHFSSTNFAAPTVFGNTNANNIVNTNSWGVMAGSTDSRGIVYWGTGATTTANVCIVTNVFATAYAVAPSCIIIQAANNVNNNGIRYYVNQTNTSTTSWQIWSTGTTPTISSTNQFYYWVIE